jgi:hypothetical protein
VPKARTKAADLGPLACEASTVDGRDLEAPAGFAGTLKWIFGLLAYKNNGDISHGDLNQRNHPGGRHASSTHPSIDLGRDGWSSDAGVQAVQPSSRSDGPGDGERPP